MTLYSENIVMEKPQIEIEYCIICKWLLRASWISQELLSTFSNEISRIALIPSDVAGIFEIRSGKKIIWDNPFLGTGFNDQEIAIATLLTNARNVSQGTQEALYPAYKSYEDYVIINHIRQSSQ